jgi:IMP dehydrogenase
VSRDCSTVRARGDALKILSTVPEITFDDVLLLTNRCEYTIAEETLRTDVRAKLSRNIALEVPLVSSPMPGVSGLDMVVALSECGAFGILHAFQGFGSQLEDAGAAKQKGARVGAAIYEHSEASFAHARRLVEAGVDLISVESVQAHNTQTLDFIRRLKDSIPGVEVSVGTVTTVEACEDLIDAGADSIRVGIGGGSHCTTRLMTGVGRPYLSTLHACEAVTRKAGVPLIVDGGVRLPGDVAKALVFGADVVMIGGLFAGTDESPGTVIERDGKRYKQSWGACTLTAAKHEQDYGGTLHNVNAEQRAFEEGVQGLIPYRGSVRDVVSHLVAGLRRSMWYQGVTSIEEMRERATVVLCSPGTHAETSPRI